jgi:hypothetical protein
MGVNALRCAFLNGFVNVHYLLSAAFYVARQFSQVDTLQEKLDEYYPYLCTCQKDVDEFSKYFSDDANAGDFATCAEV